jgi:hypothetical protein
MYVFLELYFARDSFVYSLKLRKEFKIDNPADKKIQG